MATEAAIAFPVVLIAAIGLMQFAIYRHATNVVVGAVQDGAEVAARADYSVQDGVNDPPRRSSAISTPPSPAGSGGTSSAGLIRPDRSSPTRPRCARAFMCRAPR